MFRTQTGGARDWTRSGTPGRIRTYDPKIKSLLLYQLSYGGVRLGGMKP